jgi:hypothetical protein
LECYCSVQFRATCLAHLSGCSTRNRESGRQHPVIIAIWLKASQSFLELDGKPICFSVTRAGSMRGTHQAAGSGSSTAAPSQGKQEWRLLSSQQKAVTAAAGPRVVGRGASGAIASYHAGTVGRLQIFLASRRGSVWVQEILQNRLLRQAVLSRFSPSSYLPLYCISILLVSFKQIC